MECLFCKIVAGEIPSTRVDEDERTIAESVAKVAELPSAPEPEVRSEDDARRDYRRHPPTELPPPDGPPSDGMPA